MKILLASGGLCSYPRIGFGLAMRYLPYPWAWSGSVLHADAPKPLVAGWPHLLGLSATAAKLQRLKLQNTWPAPRASIASPHDPGPISPPCCHMEPLSSTYGAITTLKTLEACAEKLYRVQCLQTDRTTEFLSAMCKYSMTYNYLLYTSLTKHI